MGPTTSRCENVEYLTSTTDDSVITCDEINAADSVSKMGQQMLWVLCQQIFIKWIAIFRTQFY